MHLSVTVPEELLNRLRAGALDALLAPIHEPVEQARQGTLSPRFKRASALLDVIGWQAGEAAEEVVIDMVDHAPALSDALSYAFEDALRDLREVERAHGCACNAADLCCRLEREEAEWSLDTRRRLSRPLTSNWWFRIAYLSLAGAVGLSVAWAEGRPYVLVGAFVTIALARIVHDARKHRRSERLKQLLASARRKASRGSIDSPEQTR